VGRGGGLQRRALKKSSCSQGLGLEQEAACHPPSESCASFKSSLKPIEKQLNGHLNQVKLALNVT